MSRNKKLLEAIMGKDGATTRKAADETAEVTGVDVTEDGVKIITPEEAEKVDYVICSPIFPCDFKDDILGTCGKCGIPIHYRPHAPKRPTKICFFCAIKLRKTGEH